MRKILFVVLCIFATTTTANAIELLPDRTGISVGPEAKYDSYGSSHINSYGGKVFYKNKDYGTSVGARTGWGLVREAGVTGSLETQYFGIEANQKLISMDKISIGPFATFNWQPPFGKIQREALMPGYSIPTGTQELQMGIISQLSAKEFSVYAAPEFRLFQGKETYRRIDASIGVQYKISDRISVAGDFAGTGKNNLHFSGGIAFHF